MRGSDALCNYESQKQEGHFTNPLSREKLRENPKKKKTHGIEKTNLMHICNLTFETASDIQPFL
jgi:hypothetical protein